MICDSVKQNRISGLSIAKKQQKGTGDMHFRTMSPKSFSLLPVLPAQYTLQGQVITQIGDTILTPVLTMAQIRDLLTNPQQSK